MSEMYFSALPTSAHDRKCIAAAGLSFVTDAGTFSKDGLDVGSETLLSALPDTDGRCLDLGCGWGPIGLIRAQKNPASQWVLVDINARAAALSKENAEKNGIGNVQVCCQDGIRAEDGLFSLIATNPPIRTGKKILYELFAQCHAHLQEDGKLYLVIRKKQGADSAKTYLKTLFGNCETVKRNAGFHVLLCVKDTKKEAKKAVFSQE